MDKLTFNITKSKLSCLFKADTWIFDLDNTLYSATSDLFSQIDLKMTHFVAKHLKIEMAKAREIQKNYFRKYGTTMRGLMTLHSVNPSDFLEYVHDIDLTPIKEEPKLNLALSKLPGRKVIFTNASTTHAERVITKLGIKAHFEAIFDIIDSDYMPKPEISAYTKLCKELKIEPNRSVMVEDMACNLLPAHNLGMKTVWVDTGVEWSQNESSGAHIHFKTDNLSEWLTELTSSNGDQ